MQLLSPLLTSLPLLSLLIWLPIVGGGLLFVLARETQPVRAVCFALLVSLLSLCLCVGMWAGFDPASPAFQLVEMHAWFPYLQINYSLGVDGFAVPLIVLTCFFTPLVIIAAWGSIKQQFRGYLAAFLIMQGLMCGVFAALDAILFYAFWEAMLVPMFLIIGIWGGPKRIYATIKFFLYTFLGSVLFLVALIYLHSLAQAQGAQASFAISTFAQLPLPLVTQKWVLVAFLLAFAVKIPMVPVHTWLPDAHVEAPTGGSVVLAAILLKMGAYGFLRFILPIVPDASREWQNLIIGASLVGVVYIGLIAIVQKDMKKLIAYSSIAHMGFVTLGLFIAFALLNQDLPEVATMGIQGAYFQMISHGFISGALFLCVGVLYDRLHSRKIADYGGVVNTMPVFSSFFVLFAFANAGLPGTSGFVGEFWVILSAFQARPLFALLATSTLILGAAYTLWMVKRVVFGEVANARVASLKDLTPREWIYMSILAAMVLLFGLWPAPVVNITEASVAQLLQHIGQPKY